MLFARAGAAIPNRVVGPLPTFVVLTDFVARGPAASTVGPGGPFGRVLVRWLDGRNAINAATVLAVAEAALDGPAAARTRGLAELVKLQAVERLPVVAKLFADTTVVGKVARLGPPAVVQLRDTALAAAVLMTGQSPADYGFTCPPGRPGGFGNLMYGPDAPADEARAAAFKKWAAWGAARPRPAP